MGEPESRRFVEGCVSEEIERVLCAMHGDSRVIHSVTGTNHQKCNSSSLTNRIHSTQRIPPLR